MKQCEYKDCQHLPYCKKTVNDECELFDAYSKAKSECVAVLDNRLKHYLETVDRNIKNNEFNNDPFHGAISELERLIVILKKQ